MSNSNLVQWVEWTDSKGVRRSITVDEWDTMPRIGDWEIDFPRGKVRKHWLPRGTYPKCWELKQYVTHPIPGPCATEEAVKGDSAEEVAGPCK